MSTRRANIDMAETAAPGNAAVRTNKRQRWADTDFAILHVLEELSPAFCWPRAPLAIGIFDGVREPLDGEYGVDEIQHFLRWFCGTTHYLEAVAAGRVRLALDGTAPKHRRTSTAPSRASVSPGGQNSATLPALFRTVTNVIRPVPRSKERPRLTGARGPQRRAVAGHEPLSA